ncbi:hypothetical protein [Anaerolentibacter hominis]|uniref:hypothetical protein n=1 Tax=Anaerolentibacter hominis TaxID=3079009 RepID=UPI0031B82711
MSKKLVIGASIGNCVHVAGAVHFLNMAADEGYDTLFLGPAVSIDEVIRNVKILKPYMVTLGYRLTPENVVPLIRELKEKAQELTSQPRWVFGGTRPVAELVRKENFFEMIFDGTDDIDESIAFLRNVSRGQAAESYEDNLVSRINQKKPYPLLRHHFGRPSYDDTLKGIEQIAESKVLDVISLGPDQNTQQYFFRPQERDPKMDGAGGVPIHTEQQFRDLKEASRTGNYPLIRCYSGTADVIQFAGLLEDTIHNAWCAVPLSWYNEMDGRGTRPVEVSMREALDLMRWHGERNIPVEVNEPHHWGLRDAHDIISVVMAYLSAYNAKKSGVKDYIAQYMFNVPNSMSFSMDLAKILAAIEMVESLKDDSFRIYREVRAGLPLLSGDFNIAKGQLAASTQISMAVNPDIIHVVGYSEAEHAATPEVVIESCKIVRGVIRCVLYGNADSTQDAGVQERKAEIMREAGLLLNFIHDQYSHYSKDPFGDPMVLSDCIKRGIIDAPHIVKNDRFIGILETRVLNGKCVAYDSKSQKTLTEEERLAMLKQRGNLENIGVFGNKLAKIG